MNTGLALSRENRLALIILAVAQSLLLLCLHKALNHDFWPATDPRWLHGLYTVVIGLPFFFYLGAVDWRDRANRYAAIVLALLLFWTGWHTGWLSSPHFSDDGYGNYSTVPAMACGVLIALFLLAFHFRTQRETGRLDYRGLLEHSWRNALTLGFLGLFLIVFWLLLNLWAELFDVIGIDFFKTLFYEPEFVYPVFGLVGGWGLGLIRARSGLIATVRSLCEVLIRALLPLVAFILVIFLCALPFTGLAPLWGTGFAAVLLLSLAAVLLFFFNAVIADDAGNVAGFAWLRHFVLLALILLPINAVLAGWSLWLRIDQYGLTVDRLWAVFVHDFIAAFSFGYAVIILRHRGLDIAAIRLWNTVLAIALAVALFVVNLPILDFHRIAANSQIERLLEGRTPVTEFDARYLRFELGVYGIDELKALQQSEFTAKRPELKAKIEEAFAAKHRWAPQAEVARDDVNTLRERFIPLPGTNIDDSFLLMLGAKGSGVQNCFDIEGHCVIGDLEYHGRQYRMLVSSLNRLPVAIAWQRQDDDWKKIGFLRRFGCEKYTSDHMKLDEPFVAIDSEYFVFRNGDCLYQVEPDAAAVRQE